MSYNRISQTKYPNSSIWIIAHVTQSRRFDFQKLHFRSACVDEFSYLPGNIERTDSEDVFTLASIQASTVSAN